jgi:photosynthetic reaction center H subunit
VDNATFGGYFDVAQFTLYLFWLFFAGLIFYIRREDRREGYPLESDTNPGKLLPASLLFYPAPKTYKMPHGGTVMAPTGAADRRPLVAKPMGRWPGAPLVPNGANPMRDSIGPGSWAERADEPDMTHENTLKIVPIRVATGYHVASNDPDPRGYTVRGDDGVAGGTVVDIWVDRSECIIRYYEVETGTEKASRRVLLPATFCVVRKTPRSIVVSAILGSQFAMAPQTAKPTCVTLLEEDIICAYYGAGTLYATPARQEPIF